MNLPNILSVSRIFLLIPIILLFEYGQYLFSLVFFIVGSISDYLDGYLARKNNQTSDLGSLLDLLADKIFVSTLLIWLTFHFADPIILTSSILIISREISISYLRLFIVSQSKDLKEVKSDWENIHLQMIGLGFILISPDIFHLSFIWIILYMQYSIH